MLVTAEEKKAQTLQGVREARRAVLAAAAAVPLEATDTVFLGEWSVKDIIAHIIGWDYANIEAVRAVLAGSCPHSMPIATVTGAPLTPAWWGAIDQRNTKPGCAPPNFPIKPCAI